MHCLKFLRSLLYISTDLRERTHERESERSAEIDRRKHSSGRLCRGGWFVKHEATREFYILLLLLLYKSLSLSPPLRNTPSSRGVPSSQSLLLVTSLWWDCPPTHGRGLASSVSDYSSLSSAWQKENVRNKHILNKYSRAEG